MFRRWRPSWPAEKCLRAVFRALFIFLRAARAGGFSCTGQACRWTRWATPGMLSPCWDEVVDISAPVAINRTLSSVPCSMRFSTSEHRTPPEQPQPEPPA